jgi:Na+-driven multidrug efflux pump
MLAGAAVFAVLLTLHSMDNLMNAMLNPIFILGLGGLAGAVAGGATAPIAARRSKAVEVQPIGAPPRPRRVVPA